MGTGAAEVFCMWASAWTGSRGAGEQPPVEDKGPPQGVSLDSFAGPVPVEWDTEAALTPLGQLP
jgi:hypothetical protein